MLSARRSLQVSISSTPELPRVPELEDLYRFPFRPRVGQLGMIAGRSGQGKSTLALFIASQMGVPCLYFSADMSARDASIKVACASLQADERTVEDWVDGGGEPAERVWAVLGGSSLTFAHGTLTWAGMDAELDAYVDVWNRYPELIVIDNLMDIEGCESEYQAQQEAMQRIHRLKELTGSSVIVLHHCSDKNDAGPYEAVPRKGIKNGLSEKPDWILTVGMNPYTSEAQVAVVKQRMGKQDAGALSPAKLRAVPEWSRFEKWRDAPVPAMQAPTQAWGLVGE